MTTTALPNFIIVGVSRAGTTTLFNAMAAHPEVCSSTTKETRYFQAIRYSEPLAPLTSYETYFRRYAGEPVTMESTPDYFYGGAATAAAIAEVCDQPRITVILREPIDRLISFYRFMQARLQVPDDMTLPEYVERCQSLGDSVMNDRASNVFTGLWGGQYARHLPDWLAAYPDRCDVYFFDDLLADPAPLLADQCQRLGIDPDLLPTTAAVDNTSAGYRSSAAQRVAAGVAKHTGTVLRRYPGLYANARRAYEAVNQRQSEATTIAETARREITALYQPWNELLAQQLIDAGHDRLPTWLTS